MLRATCVINSELILYVLLVLCIRASKGRVYCERELRPSRPPLHHKPQVTCVGAILYLRILSLHYSSPRERPTFYSCPPSAARDRRLVVSSSRLSPVGCWSPVRCCLLHLTERHLLRSRLSSLRLSLPPHARSVALVPQFSHLEVLLVGLLRLGCRTLSDNNNQN